VNQRMADDKMRKVSREFGCNFMYNSSVERLREMSKVETCQEPPAGYFRHVLTQIDRGTIVIFISLPCRSRIIQVDQIGSTCWRQNPASKQRFHILISTANT
jgi:hypothetical protein